jgi:hypothetical protein
MAFHGDETGDDEFGLVLMLFGGNGDCRLT